MRHAFKQRPLQPLLLPLRPLLPPTRTRMTAATTPSLLVPRNCADPTAPRMVPSLLLPLTAVAAIVRAITTKQPRPSVRGWLEERPERADATVLLGRSLVAMQSQVLLARAVCPEAPQLVCR